MIYLIARDGAGIPLTFTRHEKLQTACGQPNAYGLQWLGLLIHRGKIYISTLFVRARQLINSQPPSIARFNLGLNTLATDQLTTPVDSQVHVTDVAQPSADDCIGYRHHLYLRLGAAKRVPTGFAVTSQCHRVVLSEGEG